MLYHLLALALTLSLYANALHAQDPPAAGLCYSNPAKLNVQAENTAAFLPRGQNDRQLTLKNEPSEALSGQRIIGYPDTQVSHSFPQDTSRLWLVVTTDGNRYVGQILEDNKQSIVIETQVVGTVTIPKQNIKRLEPVDSQTKMRDGSIWGRNPQADRYFLFNSAYGLDAGEAYYQNALVLFNQVNIGITDNISTGVGIVPAFLYQGPTPFWLAPKVSIPVASDQFQLGGGALIGTTISSGNSGFGGVAFGLGTVGSRDRNLTLGVGYGFTDRGWLDIPAFTISGMLRIGQKGYLIGDSFLLSANGSTGGLVAFGGRTVWPNIALEYGGFTAFADDEILPAVLPWLGVSVFFGNR